MYYKVVLRTCTEDSIPDHSWSPLSAKAPGTASPPNDVDCAVDCASLGLRRTLLCMIHGHRCIVMAWFFMHGSAIGIQVEKPMTETGQPDRRTTANGNLMLISIQSRCITCQDKVNWSCTITHSMIVVGAKWRAQIRLKTLIKVLPDSGLGASDITLLNSVVVIMVLIFSAMPDPWRRVGSVESVPMWVNSCILYWCL